MASTLYRPFLRGVLVRFGAPGDLPPCIRQWPFGLTSDWQKAPLLCPRSTPLSEVHRQFAWHGVDPVIFVDPLGVDHPTKN